MEAHIGIPKRKQKNASKKDKTKKNIGGLSVTLPSLPPSAELDSAGNSPCSPVSPRDDVSGILFRLTCDSQLPPQHSYRIRLNPRTSPSVTPVSDREHDWQWPSDDSLHPEALFANFIGPLPAEERARQLTSSIRSRFQVTRLERCRKLPEATNSPRQRNKIRTNPWLTPKMCGGGDDEHRRSYLASSSSSDCASLCNSSVVTPSDGSCCGDSCMASTEGSDASTSEVGFVHDRLTEALEATSSPVRLLVDSECCSIIRRPPHLGFGNRLPALCQRSTPMKQRRREDCRHDEEYWATLNETKGLEYDLDTLESEVLIDNQNGIRRFDWTWQPRNSYRKKKLEFHNLEEVYSVTSDSLDDDWSCQMSLAKNRGKAEGQWKLALPVEDVIVREEEAASVLERGGFQTDSAFPSESEASSLEASVVTTPLLGTTMSCSSSDSGIQPSVSKSTSTFECQRSLESVRESLCEKVQRLRLERLVVEEKIRDAKEEEELRRAEKDRFQKELVIHRRLVLLRTLRDLRVKLEEQSARLQDAYQVTLRMQLSRRQLTVAASEKAPLGRLM